MECGFVSIIKLHLYPEEEVYTGAWHDYLKIMFISLTFLHQETELLTFLSL